MIKYLITQRLESMSPDGFLRLIRQPDGDILVTVSNENGKVSCIEFCTPMAGGGGSKRTYAALIQLMAAMAADNLDNTQAGRRPNEVDMDQQKDIVEWGEASAAN